MLSMSDRALYMVGHDGGGRSECLRIVYCSNGGRYHTYCGILCTPALISCYRTRDLLKADKVKLMTGFHSACPGLP